MRGESLTTTSTLCVLSSIFPPKQEVLKGKVVAEPGSPHFLKLGDSRCWFQDWDAWRRWRRWPGAGGCSLGGCWSLWLMPWGSAAVSASGALVPDPDLALCSLRVLQSLVGTWHHEGWGGRPQPCSNLGSLGRRF